PCVMTQDCTAGTCFRGMCGPAFVLSYQDTPETGSDPTQAKWIRFQFQIENRTSASYPLSAFTLRYYYTPERAVSQFQALSTSAPPADVSKVTGTFGKTNGWTYLEVGFTNSAGTLNGSGASTGIVKVGIHDQNFTDFVFYQPDDYSYLKPEHITLYLNSVLVAGVEPVTPPPQ
ncbi:MAG TPA: cellulose binding domain-containing protein, partial [Polyangiaceae bacterium]|nr:cellulose binding domain-containing protein [Polyangiaceae bacterium]